MVTIILGCLILNGMWCVDPCTLISLLLKIEHCSQHVFGQKSCQALQMSQLVPGCVLTFSRSESKMFSQTRTTNHLNATKLSDDSL